MLQKAYGKEISSRKIFYEWLRRFKEGRNAVKVGQRSGRPTSCSDENVRVRQKIQADRRFIIRELAEEVNISYGSRQSILTDNIGMRRIAAKFEPRLVMIKTIIAEKPVLSSKIRAENDSNSIINSIIIGEETWVYGYHSETKAQSSQKKTANSPWLKSSSGFARMSKQR